MNVTNLIRTETTAPPRLFRTLGVAALSLALCGCGGSKATPDPPGPGMTTTTADSTTGALDAETSSSTSTGATTGASDNMQLFLLFGQSNMEGAPKAEAQDMTENPRVQVLAYGNFSGRTWNEWAVASPPLHRSWAGLGPGDYFGKAMAEAWPDATIGLIPCAISGVDIDFFRKGLVSTRRGEFDIPPDNSRDSAYDMMLERVQVAQQSGVLRGILFHQGESDSGNSAWVDKVAEIVRDLHADLGLAESVPFLAGELLYTGCCSGHNQLVRQLPAAIPNAHVVSAEGLTELEDPYNAHFDLPAQREFGKRYAETMLSLLEAP